MLPLLTSLSVAGFAVAPAAADEPETRLIIGTYPHSSPYPAITSVASDGSSLVDVVDASASYLGATLAGSATRDGRYVAFTKLGPGDPAAAQWDVHVLDRATGTDAKITDTPGSDEFQPKISHDGTKVAWIQYRTASAEQAGYDLVVANVDGSDRRVILPLTELVADPEWAPDDEHLLISLRLRTGFFSADDELYTIRPDGTGLTRITHTPGIRESGTSYSPDGEHIMYQAYGGGMYGIYIADRTGALIRTVVEEVTVASHTAWSPDGTQVAWFGTDPDTRQQHIYIAPADGGIDPFAVPLSDGRRPGQGAITWVTTGPWDEPDEPADEVAPTAAIAAPVDGARLSLNGAASLDYSCTDDIAIATCTAQVDGVPSADGAALPTSATGAHHVVVTATDTSGNTTTATSTYYVDYATTGLTGPVSSSEMNSAKAGQVVPFKFRLTDANDTPMSSVTAVSITSKQVTCASLGEPADSVEEYAPGGNGLQNLGDGSYQWNWKTPKSYANTCRVATIYFGTDRAGGSVSAAFRFTK